MTDAFINNILEKVENISDGELLVFKIIMEIHLCHEKIKFGLCSDDVACKELLEYYRSLSGVTSPITTKMDTVYFDVWDIPYVYSVEMDSTFPLVAYPYKLFMKHYNVDGLSVSDLKISKKIKFYNFKSEVREYIKINGELEFLSPEGKKQMKIHSFFE